MATKIQIDKRMLRNVKKAHSRAQHINVDKSDCKKVMSFGLSREISTNPMKSLTAFERTCYLKNIIQHLA